MKTTNTAVVGLQWGDEGKGKIVDILADQHDAVVRYNGGANAGHSVVINGERFALHLIPAGIMRAGKPAIVGNGVVIDPDWLSRELDTLAARGVDTSGLVLSDRAHVVMPWHKVEDELRERLLSEGSMEPIGTTKRGIGPCYADKALRSTAIRMGDLLRPDELAKRLPGICKLKSLMLGAAAAASGGSAASDPAATNFQPEAMLELCGSWAKRFAPYITDTSAKLLGLMEQGKRVLFEGANATMLDVDHGTYPFVTSSSCSAPGAAPGSGVPPHAVGEVLGVMKAYSTRVGGGPMPTELVGTPELAAMGERIRQKGREFGTTTGRPRRVGWLDLVVVKYAARLNGASKLSVMLLDVLSAVDELKVCTAYEIDGTRTDQLTPAAHWIARAKPVYQTVPAVGDLTGITKFGELPSSARQYLDLIEKTVNVPIRFVSIGPDRAQTIDRG